MMYYDNANYASDRLRNTIVNSKKGPVFVTGVVHDNENIGICHVRRLKDEEDDFVLLKDIDLTPVSLGYINLVKTSLFLSRKPIRAWRQGLSMDSLSFNDPDHGFIKWPFKEMYNVIVGNYPSLEEAETLLKKKERVAFSRKFAIGKDILYYCGRPVGKFDKVFQLDENNQFLKEYLHEVVEEEMVKK